MKTKFVIYFVRKCDRFSASNKIHIWTFWRLFIWIVVGGTSLRTCGLKWNVNESYALRWVEIGRDGVRTGWNVRRAASGADQKRRVSIKSPGADLSRVCGYRPPVRQLPGRFPIYLSLLCAAHVHLFIYIDARMYASGSVGCECGAREWKYFHNRSLQRITATEPICVQVNLRRHAAHHSQQLLHRRALQIYIIWSGPSVLPRKIHSGERKIRQFVNSMRQVIGTTLFFVFFNSTAGLYNIFGWVSGYGLKDKSIFRWFGSSYSTDI